MRKILWLKSLNIKSNSLLTNYFFPKYDFIVKFGNSIINFTFNNNNEKLENFDLRLPYDDDDLTFIIRFYYIDIVIYPNVIENVINIERNNISVTILYKVQNISSPVNYLYDRGGGLISNRIGDEYNNQVNYKVLNKRDRILYLDMINRVVLNIHPTVFTFLLRRKVDLMVSRIKVKKLNRQILKISRKSMVESTVNSIVSLLSDEGSRLNVFNLRVKYENELGEDLGSIRKEFIGESLKKMRNYFYEGKPLFILSYNGLFDVNEETVINEDDDYDGLENYFDEFTRISTISSMISSETDFCMKFYFTVGAIIGMALVHKEPLSIPFCLGFYENLLKREFTIDHIQDEQVQRSLLYLIENSQDGGKEESIEDGESSLVNIYQKDLDKTIEVLLCSNRKERIYNYVRAGFIAIIGNIKYYSTVRGLIPLYKHILNEFTAIELASYFNLHEAIDIEILKSLIVYQNCSLEETREIIWLWEILGRFSNFQMMAFLKFFTGSTHLVRQEDPIKQKHPYTVTYVAIKNRIITSSTCSCNLHIFQYESKEVMERIIKIAIFECDTFELV